MKEAGVQHGRANPPKNDDGSNLHKNLLRNSFIDKACALAGFTLEKWV